MKKFWRRLPLIVVVAGAAGLLVYGFWPVPIEVDAVIVARGSFDITVDDDGETRIREKHIVTSPVLGNMLRVELHAGDVVKQGETVLARIEPRHSDPLDARSKAEAEARIRSAEASCNVTAARRKYSNEELELAKHNYDRSRVLLEKRTISRSEFDQAEHQFHMAEANLRSADFAVLVADFESELARAALVQTGKDLNSSESASTITLVSPVEGHVLRVFTEDAGVVEPGTRIMEVGNLRDLEMEIDVLSTESVRIKPGATVYVDHWGGDGTLKGIVRVVEPAAFLKVSALGVEEKRVNIIADFRDPFESQESVGDGFRIEARIVVATADNVVKVPAGVLFRQDRSWHAYRIVNGKAWLQQVKIGKTNGLETEIIEGLSPGDLMVLHPTDKVADGIPLKTTLLKLTDSP